MDHAVSLGRHRAPAGRRVIAVGDIHGELELLDALLAKARERFRDEAAPMEFVFLGDYVDRGPTPKGVVQRLCDLADGPDAATFLMGNHEHLMLRFLERDDVGAAETWFGNGGMRTLESYGVRPPRVFNLREDIPVARRGLEAALPSRHRQFLRGLETSHVAGDLIFTHAGLRPGIPLDEQRPTDLMWIRDVFLDSDMDHGGLVVHGHTSRFSPEVRRNRIGIDTGAGKGGYLTAAVFWGSEVSFLHAGS